MKSVLRIDVANEKSEVLLITEYGEVLIETYEVKHCLSEFNLLIYYRKKQAENKHFKECIIACSTKLLRTIFAMCKNNIT